MARRSDRRPPSVDAIARSRRTVIVRRYVPSPVTFIEDRRLFHPLGAFAPARSLDRRSRLIVHPPNVNKSVRRNDFRVPSAVGFDVPSRVAVCVRRKQRKEVLHAKRFTGRGSGGGKHRRNYWSDVRC